MNTRAIRDLSAAVEQRRNELDMPLWQLHVQADISQSAWARARTGVASDRTCQQLTNWLRLHPAPSART